MRQKPFWVAHSKHAEESKLEHFGNCGLVHRAEQDMLKMWPLLLSSSHFGFSSQKPEMTQDGFS